MSNTLIKLVAVVAIAMFAKWAGILDMAILIILTLIYWEM